MTSPNPAPAPSREELLETALKTLRSFMWSEGYSDTTPAMAQADRAISAPSEEVEKA